MKSVPTAILYTACVATFVIATIINRIDFFVNKDGQQQQQQRQRQRQQQVRSSAAAAAGNQQQQTIFKELDSIGTSVKKISEQLLAAPPKEETTTSLRSSSSGGGGGGGSSSGKQLEGVATNNNCESRLDDLEHTWDLRRKARETSIAAWAKGRNVAQLFDIFEPEAVCLDDERFGSSIRGGGAADDDEEQQGYRYKAFGDGPKFVCGIDRIVEKAKQQHNPGNGNGGGCLIYSVGSNNQIDFEVSVNQAFGKGNCEIHTFDPTIHPQNFIGSEYTTFHNWGFGKDGVQTQINHRTRGIFDFTEMSILTAMKTLNHQNRTIDIFKIDCEGCEYTALTAAFNAIAEGLIKIDQVQVEVHSRGDFPAIFPSVHELFQAADRANMRVFHKERNGWGCGGNKCVEYAFASNDFLRRANAHYMCN